MSFYNRSGGLGGLVRFPGLNGLVRFPGLGRYSRYGAFGDVSDAQDALTKANAAVATLKAKIKAQVKLVAFSEKALKNCSEEAGNIIMGLATAGAGTLVCIAAQQTALGQRKGVLAAYENDLELAQAEVANAKIALAQAKADALAPPIDDVVVDPVVVVDSNGTVTPRPTVTSTSTAKASGAASGGGMFSNPLMLAAIGIPVVGGLLYVLTRRRSGPVAGYGRRSRSRSRR